MIKITRIVDRSVLEKVDTDKLRELLPDLDKEVALIICATKQEREEDVWEKDGVVYVRVVLDFDKVVSSSEEEVLGMIEKLALKKLNSIS